MMAHLSPQASLLGPHEKRHLLPIRCQACSQLVVPRLALERANEHVVATDSGIALHQRGVHHCQPMRSLASTPITALRPGGLQNFVPEAAQEMR